MKDDAVKTALERSVKAVSLKPSVGQGTAVTRIRLREGLACDVEDGRWKLAVGMSDRYGGTNEGPNPGVLGRAAFGACLTLGYAMWAARLGVPIDSLDVEVHADYDARGELGVSDDVHPGYSRIRYVVSVSSPASRQEVDRWLDTADRYSSWRDNLARAVPLVVERQITITAGR